LKTAYLSLGSNLDDREANLRRAIELLASPEIRIKRTSSLYETEPQDLPHQPWFLNLVVEIETSLFPLQLLARIQRIEKELGRQRRVPKGPRTIDIDILLFSNFVIDAESLVIPHPRFRERRFVLAPLADLAPHLRDPVTGKSMRELLTELKGQVVRRVDSAAG
jgi:2-amino-4-hydroxy-6-hydroxymethyldihydropteridine diphosphokinase